MARGKNVTPDTPIVPPAWLARLRGVSIEVVESTAKRLGIEFATTTTGRRALSYRESERIDRAIDSTFLG